MRTIADNEFVDENTTLDTAAHLMFVKNRLSLLVMCDESVRRSSQAVRRLLTVLDTMKKTSATKRNI